MKGGSFCYFTRYTPIFACNQYQFDSGRHLSLIVHNCLFEIGHRASMPVSVCYLLNATSLFRHCIKMFQRSPGWLKYFNNSVLFKASHYFVSTFSNLTSCVAVFFLPTFSLLLHQVHFRQKLLFSISFSLYFKQQNLCTEDKV